MIMLPEVLRPGRGTVADAAQSTGPSDIVLHKRYVLLPCAHYDLCKNTILLLAIYILSSWLGAAVLS